MPALLLSIAFFAAKPASLHQRATDAFRRADYKRALDLLTQDLVQTGGTPLEAETRGMIVLTLYNTNKHGEAVDAYGALLRLVPSFHFDEEQVLPEVITFFEEAVPRPKPKPEPKEIVAAPAASAPIAIVEPPPVKPVRKWSPAYLIPLGVGQYIARSPVRGTVFLITQLGFLGLNIASALLYGNALYPDGSARDLQTADTWKLTTNLAFAGLLTAIVAGAVDGIFFEP